MLIDRINVAEWFRTKSPSLERCKEGDLETPSFEHFELDMYVVSILTFAIFAWKPINSLHCF